MSVRCVGHTTSAGYGCVWYTCGRSPRKKRTRSASSSVDSSSYMYIYNIIADTDLSLSFFLSRADEQTEKLGVKDEGNGAKRWYTEARVTHDALFFLRT